MKNRELLSYINGTWEYPDMIVDINVNFETFAVDLIGEDGTRIDGFYAQGEEANEQMESVLEVVERNPDRNFSECIRDIAVYICQSIF